MLAILGISILDIVLANNMYILNNDYLSSALPVSDVYTSSGSRRFNKEN
jgi:hypothetical protein